LTTQYNTSYQHDFAEKKNYTPGEMIEYELNALYLCKENVKLD